MADLRAYVANCLIGGHSITRNGNSWTRDTIEFSCAGKTLVLKQNTGVVTGSVSDFTGRFVETTEIVVREVQPPEVEKTLAVVDRVCWLLSLAGLSRVVRYGHDYPDGSAQGGRRSVVGSATFFRPTIEIRDGALVKAFVEQLYPNYTRLEKSRKLNVVIDYLLQAERSNQPTECRLIFAFVLLENLKDTFARSRSIPYEKGFFRKSAGPRAPKYSFEELLQLMFRAAGMRRGLKRVIRLRNEIVHSGLSQKSHRLNWSMYEKIHDLLREYLLRLLGFRGHYLRYSGGGNVAAAV